MAPVDHAFRAVADSTRRDILRLVGERELAAGEIARQFPAMSRPAVSQHLRILVDAELVSVRAEGNRRLYRLRPTGFANAAEVFESLWLTRLALLKRAAERAERDS